MPVQYEIMMRARSYLPEIVKGETSNDVAAELETIVYRHANKKTFRSVHCDVMTDQIDVYVNDRKIATYMFM